MNCIEANHLNILDGLLMCKGNLILVEPSIHLLVIHNIITPNSTTYLI